MTGRTSWRTARPSTSRARCSPSATADGPPGAGALAPNLLIVAASARALAGLARRGGLAARYRIVAVDGFADLDTRALADVAVRFEGGLSADAGAVAAACEKATGPPRPGDRVLIGGGLERGWPVLLPRLAQLGPLVGPLPQHAALLADPEALTECLAGLPIPLPPRRFRRAPASGHWLAKPALRAGGTEVRRARPGEVLPPGWFAERQLAGRTVSVCALALQGSVRILGAAKHLSLGDAAGFSSQALAVHADPAACGLEFRRARVTAAKLAARLQYTGIFGLDVVCSPDDGPMLVDVNLRPPASLEWMASAPTAVASLLVPGIAPLASGQGPVWRGGAVVTARRAFRLDAAAARVLAEWARGAERAPGWVHDVPAAGQCFAPGAPVCTVSALAEDEATLGEALAARSRQVEALVSGRARDADPA